MAYREKTPSCKPLNTQKYLIQVLFQLPSKTLLYMGVFHLLNTNRHVEDNNLHSYKTILIIPFGIKFWVVPTVTFKILFSSFWDVGVLFPSLTLMPFPTSLYLLLLNIFKWYQVSYAHLSFCELYEEILLWCCMKEITQNWILYVIRVFCGKTLKKSDIKAAILNQYKWSVE